MSKQQEQDKGFMLYTSQYFAIQSLTDEYKGILIDAIYRYVIAETAEEQIKVQTSLKDGATAMAFGFITQAIQRSQQNYADKCAKNSENAKKRWQQDKTPAVTPAQAEPAPAATGMEIGVTLTSKKRKYDE